MIIQIDSLFRLNMQTYPQLLIIDEVESILSKIISSNNAGLITQSIMNLIKHSGTVIAMDGLME